MIDVVENRVICDMKEFCFLCKANSVIENPKIEQSFYHCTSCRIDILCNVAIVRQLDKNTKTMIEKCPKCRGKLQVIHFPRNKAELRKLQS